jgi:hypothetical protein
MTFGPGFTDAGYLPPEPQFSSGENLLDDLLKRERLTASILNIKENGFYEKLEMITNQLWFSRIVGGAIVSNYTFRVTFDLVALNGGPIGPGLTTLTLTATTQPPLIQYATTLIPTHFFGAATVSGPLLLPLPYPAAAGNNIEMWFDITNPAAQSFNIDNAYGSNLTQAYAVIEYIKT